MREVSFALTTLPLLPLPRRERKRVGSAAKLQLPVVARAKQAPLRPGYAQSSRDARQETTEQEQLLASVRNVHG